MQMKTVQVLLLVLLSSFLALAGSSARSQTFPNRPITILVPFTPGGATDVVMRLIGQKMSESTGQTVLIDNRPGGAGTVATMAVKNAAPDGYTVLFGHAGTHAVNPSIGKLQYDPVSDFRPITNIMALPHVLVVPASSPAKTVKELVELGKSRPEGLSYASQGVATGGHIVGEMFKASTGIKLVHVPYRGGAPAIADAVAGRVDLLFTSYISAGAMIRDGKLRAIGFASAQRSQLLPDVPTLAQAGYPGVELDFWFGMFAPANTPDPVLRVLNAEFVKAARTPEVLKLVNEQAALVVAGPADEFDILVKKDIVRLGTIMKEAGAKLE
jgi:tripartite-type tricarboxylate transporter receptor subunit TctC